LLKIKYLSIIDYRDAIMAHWAVLWSLECLGEGDCWLTDGPAAATRGLLMMMSIEIASVLCHSVSQEAVDTR